tara:strand:- start:1054 stop:1659 length:606 start_codon:yes stop_codon:yes gene_type:complete
MDCLEAMQDMKDNQYDLAIVDPPYGLKRFKKGIGKNDRHKIKSSAIFNNSIPTKEYILELFRISKNQIIWGANNFILPPTEYFCIWNKKQTVDNFSSAEYAWVSMGLKKPAKVFEYSIHKHNHTSKIHPTQKPVQLYKWILQNYAKEGDTILDTHLGSGSIAVACHDMGFSLDAYELDTDYYNSACKRLKEHQRQLKLPIF